MKKVILVTITLAFCINSAPAGIRGYRDTPLFSMRAPENRLPSGEYILVRSYKNITQLLISTGFRIFLYTDRDNRKDDEIFSSGYSILENINIEPPVMTQHRFDLAVENYIRTGDSRINSSLPFDGGDSFMKTLEKGTLPERIEGEYYLYINDDGRNTSLMTLDLIWKKMTIRRLKDRSGRPISEYNVYIDESQDRNIRKIIREYAAAIKKRK